MVNNLTSPGVAAITWNNNGVHIRVYFQKDDGFVYEGAWDEGSGWNSGNTKLFAAKIGTPLSAIVFSPSQPQIRLYYLDTSYVLQEYAFSGGWTKGATLPCTNITPISSLTALTWLTSESQQIRVYYQTTNSTIQEVAFSSGWSSGFTFSDVAFPGTSLSAAKIKDNVINGNPSFRVYWQGPDLILNEYAWSGNWSNSKINVSPAPSAGIAAVAWLDASGSAHIRVYLENQAGSIQELSYNDAGGWVTPPATPTSVLASFRAPIGAIVWTDSNVNLRVYVQSATSNKMTELAYSGSGWGAGTLGF